MKISNDWENLTISNDFIFSKVMRDKEICREALEILLNKKIGNINYVDDQKTINPSYNAKGIRLDIYAEDEDRIYNIEMQVVNRYNLPKRSRYYQDMIDLNIINKGETYNELKDSIVIFICKFDPFGKGMPKYTFENTCLEDKSILLNDGTAKVFFNTKSYGIEKKGKLKSFLQYIELNKINNDSFVKKIDNRVNEIKSDEERRDEYMKLRLIEMDRYMDGKAEGREEGIKEGREAGIKEGREKGIKEGIKEERIESIKNIVKIMRELGVEDDIIINKIKDKYNLTEEEINKYI